MTIEQTLDAAMQGGWEIERAKLLPEHMTPGAEYIYDCDEPAGCRGHRYRFHRLAMAVPSRSIVALVEAISGQDAGLWFTCPVANFCQRYLPAKPIEQPVERVEKVLVIGTKGNEF